MTSRCGTTHYMPKEMTSKFWHNLCQIVSKVTERSPLWTYIKTLNKPKNPEEIIVEME